MELSPEVINRVIHPTAAYLGDPDPFNTRITSHETSEPGLWDASQLNPKNRIDSLATLERALWRIDGCASLGSQFYAVPLFIHPVPPMRIDVFIPSPSSQPQHVRDLLELDRAFHTKDRTRVADLAISRHIVRKLQAWTKELPDPCGFYKSLPFGSRIIFGNITLAIENIQIEIARTYALETNLSSITQLRTIWGPEISLPPSIDISFVAMEEQIHDSTSLVCIDGKRYILKSLTNYPKFLYHELRQLLSLLPHPNIISRPVHLVTKQVKFGSKHAIIGFTLEYHVHGTLRDVIPHLSARNALSQADQFKWALEISTALLHHWETSGTFYPDLRLDNIVLSRDGRAIMVDFEQRGVWCEFAAPEINAIEYMRIIASEEEISEEIREEYVQVLNRLCPGSEGLLSREKYTDSPLGYNVAWLSLSRAEQEAAEVYMFARVLWCIFEAVSAPQKAAIWVSYRFESHLEFPTYQRTPASIRSLIDECIRGWRPTLDSKIARHGSVLVLRDAHGIRTDKDDLLLVARQWWKKEIVWAKRFLAEREQKQNSGVWNGNPFNRPGLRQVVRRIEEIRAELGL